MGEVSDQNYWNSDSRFIVKRLITGDKEAFEGIFYSLNQKLRYYAFKLTQSEFIADDIVQEVFVKLWMHRKNLKPDVSLKSYIYSMVRHRAINHLEQMESRSRIELEISKGLSHANRNQTENDLIFAEYMEKVESLIKGLPLQKRKIYQMARNEGVSPDKIADKLKISQKTVKNNLAEINKFLRTELKPSLEITFVLTAGFFFL